MRVGDPNSPGRTGSTEGMPGNAGSITVEVMIVLPVLMVTILMCMQVSLLFFARSVALAASQEGVRAARAEGASRAVGATVAQRYAARMASGFLTSISASATSDTNTVRVTVRGRSLSLVPFPPAVEVIGESSGAVERFTTPR